LKEPIRKRGRPQKHHVLQPSEAQDIEDLPRLKRTRLQQKASIPSSPSPLDPFEALNMMPGITPESPKKDHCDLKPKVSGKGKQAITKTGASTSAPPNVKTKVHHHYLTLLLLTSSTDYYFKQK
jgi:hypothetical protein